MGELTPTIQWHTAAFKIDFVQNEKGVLCVRHIIPASSKTAPLPNPSEIPVINVRLVGEGNSHLNKTSKSQIGGYVSERLKYDSHKISKDGSTETLEIQSKDIVTGISVTLRLTVYGSLPVVRSVATVTNESSKKLVVTQLSSLTIGGLTPKSKTWYDDYTLLTATNTWFREAQWREQTLPELGIDENGIRKLPEHQVSSQANFAIGNLGSFSTGTYLPMGMLKSRDDTDVWLWQVENNGSWKWEIGDNKDSVYMSASGPTGIDHGWKKVLQPNESFTSVPVALTRVSGGIEQAFAALNDYRRQIRRPHEDMEKLPIVFNDYMNCLMGDPDEKKIEALLDPVARSGAEYFVIDAGWYADDSNWWDDVGLWEPSQKRFPSGFKVLLDKIRAKGLIPGLWVEPEVVGVRSVVAERLPRDAFFQEKGERIVEKGRYQLDYRHPATIEWMNEVMHNLIVNFGAGFFKFDYNIEVMQGTDVDGQSSGVAALEHGRAYLAWVRSLLDKYPGLVIESCSSGAQRMDYAMLSVHSIQSTSDQQHPSLYAAISAVLPTAVTPEQSGTWAYPQGEWSDEINALTVVNSMLGRVYLSGRLDHLSEDQLSLIMEGMDVYKEIRGDLKDSHGVWPLGLPRWHDDWLALGLKTKTNGTYLAVWRRGGPTEKDIPLKSLGAGAESEATLLYPTRFETESTWDGSDLNLKLPNTTCARLFHVV
ncbi:related to Melibiase subfamily [Cephalotrichum gorgonifer]|uniref:alpha-galactosidase n=1 Tax=Cephalotrichum gorgonifer TaxID=2041049 RepID=A0AAE8MSF0_9PEZI|nr:related to Melibiase subfamily [Cephalotrichum gorgonifer]